MKPTYVTSVNAPRPVGPYSQACAAPSGVVFLSGQTPIDPETGTLVPGGIAEQTERVFQNIGHVLSAAGCTFQHVVKANVYLTDMADFDGMNEVYARHFDGGLPARTTVAVSGLPLGARVEIEMQAIQ